MEDNTLSARAYTGRNSSHRAPWDAMDSRWWPDIAEAISGEWPRSACLMDLRWHASQVRLGRLKRIPSRRTLIKRWGWSDHNVRCLLREETAWADPHHKSPNNLPTISQKPPTLEAKTEIEPERVSHESPKNLPEISTRADLHNNTDTQQHNNPPTPQGGTASEDIPKASPVDNSADKFDEAPEWAERPDEKPTEEAPKADPLKALWQQMEEIRGEHKAGARPRKLTAARRRTLAARVKEHTAEAVLDVCRWLWTSEHSRAVFLRTQGHEDAILRASKFDSYLDMAREPQTPSQQPAGSKTGADTSCDAEDAWSTVAAALDHWGRRPPHSGPDAWGFDDDPRQDDRFCAALLGATYREDLADAWVYLFDNIGHTVRGPKLRSRFGYHWRTHRRAEVAA